MIRKKCKIDHVLKIDVGLSWVGQFIILDIIFFLGPCGKKIISCIFAFG